MLSGIIHSFLLSLYHCNLMLISKALPIFEYFSQHTPRSFFAACTKHIADELNGPCHCLPHSQEGAHLACP